MDCAFLRHIFSRCGSYDLLTLAISGGSRTSGKGRGYIRIKKGGVGFALLTGGRGGGGSSELPLDLPLVMKQMDLIKPL